MARLIRREFVGSKFLLWLLLVIPLLLPLGIAYLIDGTVTVDHEMDDPEAFLADLRR
jgi:hypothetical protein